MEVVTSRIKTMFQPDLLRFIAAICDTRRIESNNEKMVVLCDLLYTHGINFEILGGATNRIALQIDGYAVKFAMDEQGYLDNEIEYALSPELQPYVTKSYETNGYIQVQELVEVMTKELFQVHRQGIYKILDALCQDYLLGDVGYLDKNRTNWGIRVGQPVILDYAYCHRATENLFTCSRCGAPLTYDSNYDKLMCTDRSACKMIYTYNERKRVQGKKVDEDMVKERKTESIRLAGSDISKEIEMFEDRIIGDNYFIIDNPEDMHNYNKLKEALTMQISMNGDGSDMDVMTRFEAMVDLARNPNDAKARAILEASSSDEAPEPIYTDNYQENYMYGNNGFGLRMYNLPTSDCEDDCDELEQEKENDIDPDDALSAMIDKINADKRKDEEDYERRSNEQLQEYLDKRNGRNAEVVAPVKDTKEDPEEESQEPEQVSEMNNPVVITANTTDTDEEKELKETHEDAQVTEPDVQQEPMNPEDAAVLVNGKPLPIGEEVTV